MWLLEHGIYSSGYELIEWKHECVANSKKRVGASVVLPPKLTILVCMVWGESVTCYF